MLRYESKNGLLEAQNRPMPWDRYGPILQYAGREFVQVYLGQHEWLIVNLTDPTERYFDPGYEGDNFGWAVIEKLDWSVTVRPDAEHPGPPLRTNGKPVTFDELLFAKPTKLREYLGPDDPLCPRADS